MEALVGGCEDPAEWVTAPPTPATSPEPTTGPETSMAWAPWGLLREERKDSELSLVASSYWSRGSGGARCRPAAKTAGYRLGGAGHGVGEMVAAGKVMIIHQLHRAGDPEAESTHPVRTCAGSFTDPDKMADSTEALKESKRQGSSQGWARPPPSFSPPNLSSTQHSFPEFPSQKTLQNIVTMEWETAHPYKSPSVSGLRGISRLNLS